MAAYGAAASLKNTIERILQSSRISLVPPSAEILQPVYEAMSDLQSVLRKLDDTGYSKKRTKVNALDELIKEAVWEFEDLLESHLSNQILPQLEHHLSFSVDLQSLRHHVDCFLETVKMMEVEYNIEVENMPEEEGQPISSRIDFDGISSEMVGLSDEFEKARDYLLAQNEDNWYSIIGMAGVGKTTLAKKVFEDPSIREHFDIRAWVKVGRKCEFNEALQCILAQVDRPTYDQMLTQGQGDDVDNEKLFGILEERLKAKKCLIVMDDVWDHTRLFPVDWTKSSQDMNVQILFTSRLRFLDFPEQEVNLGLLNIEESKKLLGENVFGEEGFLLTLRNWERRLPRNVKVFPL